MRHGSRIIRMCGVALALVPALGLAVACGGANNEAFETYKAFTRHLMTGRHDLAEELCSSQTARNAVQGLAREHTTAVGHGEDGNIHHAEWVLNSVDELPDGVRLDVMLEMRMSPPGTSSGFGTTVVEQRHIVVMEKRGEAWHVRDFDGRIIPDWGEVFANR